MKLLAGWQDRINQVRAQPPRPDHRVPLSARKLAGQTQIIRTSDDAQRMVRSVYEMPVSCIGMDTEYRFENERPITMKSGKEWRDIRTIQPFCLALAVVSEDVIVRFALDLRRSEWLPAVQRIIDLPVPFVCHHAPSELFVLWQLGLREPRIIWDSLLAEKALWLGRKYGAGGRSAAGDVEDLRRLEKLEEANSRRLDLDTVARRYGIQASRAATKQQLQSSFLAKPYDEPLTDEELEYCAQDAEISVLIREPQRIACDLAGICETLTASLCHGTSRRQKSVGQGCVSTDQSATHSCPRPRTCVSGLLLICSVMASPTLAARAR